ncbi:MAG TPA: hypothetical protein VMW19_08605 [Myxococcota bacterium]|nr:hypothetical protein [Myxococcota bacterium]
MLRWLMVGTLSLAGIACHMRPTPLSVQAGSTFAVMLYSGSQVGYGTGDASDPCGTAPDPERGALAFTLVHPAGETGAIPLGTRLTTSLLAHPAALQSIAPAPRAIVALVDVPADTPQGTHALYVRHQDCEGALSPTDPDPYYPYTEISVLPASVSVPSEAQPISGSPFAFQAVLQPGTVFDIDPLFRQSVPAPSVEVRLSAPVWSAELRVTYPYQTIELVDAVAWDPNGLFAENRPQQAWLRKTAPGAATVSAVARDAPFPVISLVFELQGTDPFNCTQSSCTGLVVDGVFGDSNGATILPEPSFTLVVQ